MKIFLIGAGGREHVLAWKISKSPHAEKLFCAPGNGGCQDVGEILDIGVDDYEGLVRFAFDEKIDLTVVGPEAPLVGGLVDVFEKEGLSVFGPSAKAARLEGSKIFAKEFMRKHGIPTASFRTFDQHDLAVSFVKNAQYPLVIKADGLAAGKGVIVCKDQKEAENTLKRMMVDGEFGDAARKVVIENALEGEELSVLAVCDGNHYIVLDSAQDHKRIFDEDLGPNTGGMGAYSPSPLFDKELKSFVKKQIIEPTLAGMRRDGTPFKGVLYTGLMLTHEGPKVLEFNVRFGDPEIQAILPRLKSDFLEMLTAACEGRLNDYDLHWDKRPCVSVVMSSGGYPGTYETGHEIQGLSNAQSLPDTYIFHAGTKKEGTKFVTSGGRVLAVTALAQDIHSTIQKVYQAVECVSFEHAFFRRDIGAKALAYLGKSRRLTGTNR